MARNDTSMIGRRALLAAGASGAAIAAVHALAAPTNVLAGGSQGQPAIVGEVNGGDTPTEFRTSGDDGLVATSQQPTKSGLYGRNSNAAGYAVYGANLANSNQGFLGGTAGAYGETGVNAASGVLGKTGNAQSYGVSALNGGNDNVARLAGPADAVAGTCKLSGRSGVYGVNANAGGYGVFGRNTASGNTGLVGGGADAIAGECTVAGRSGVYGHTNSTAGFGVAGRNDTGLVGWLAGAGAGVHAEAPAGQTALQVVGRATFSKSGVAVVPAGKRVVKINGIPLAGDSFVIATIQQDRAGVFVEAAVPSPAGSSITIYLNRTVPAGTRVAWFVAG